MKYIRLFCFCISNKGIIFSLLSYEDLSLGSKIQKAIVKFDPSLADLRPKCFSNNKLFISQDLKYLLGILDCMLDFIQFGKFEERHSLRKPLDDVYYWFQDNNALITMIEELAVFVNERYNIIYNNEISRFNDCKPRGVYLKHNVEIIEAVKKTGDQELIDIIKSANRVGVRDLDNEIQKLSKFLQRDVVDEARLFRKNGITWLTTIINERLHYHKDRKTHPIASGIGNFADAMNNLDLRHGEGDQFPVKDIASQRILFDMGLTLARLKLQIMSEKDLKHAKNEQ